MHCIDTLLKPLCCVRFADGTAYFHEEEKEGLVRVCRLALHQKYPKYVSDGYEALYARPPVIYVSAAAKPTLGQHLVAQVVVCTVLGSVIKTIQEQLKVPCALTGVLVLIQNVMMFSWKNAPSKRLKLNWNIWKWKEFPICCFFSCC